MMKKILFALLGAAMIVSAAACSKNNDENGDVTGDPSDVQGTTAPEDTQPEAPAGYDGTLADLVSAIYEKAPQQLSLTPGVDIDVSDPDALGYYLGITDSTGIKEAVFSESMFGSQAYSLVLARLEDGADAASIAKAVFEKVDTRKWMCVEADSLIVTDGGNIILMIMSDDEFGETITTDIYNAFAEIVGSTGEKLEK